MEEQNTEIMHQERVYNPEGMDEDEESVVQSDEQDADNDGKRKKLQNILIIGAVASIVIGVIAASFTSSVKKTKAERDQQHADELLEYEEAPEFFYTSTELRDLRAAGYTGFEIENFEIEERDAATLLREAADERQQIYEREILPYFDNASDEFKNLMRDTWVGQDKFEIPEDDGSWVNYSETVNADYVKIASAGMQCFIKFTLPDGSVGFTYISPKRYVKLAESGNMVLKIEYIVLTDGTKVLTKVTEVEL